MKKRLISTILVSVLGISVLSGCGGKETAENGAADLPVIKTYMPYFKLGNAQCIVDEISAKAGVKFEPLSSAGTSEGVQRSALIITTGEKVNWVNIDNSQPFMDWGKEGFVNDLKPYFDKYGSELPVLSMIVNDPVFEGFRGENGEIYAIPSVNYITNTALRMNQGWLNKIGKEAPKTLEELTNILREFKTVAANVDGGVPFIAGALKDFEWAFLAHGGRLFSNGYPKYYEENGEFKPYDISPMNKEGLKYVRQLYMEGLVNEDWQIAKTGDIFIGGKAGLVFTAGGTDERLYANTGDVSAWLEAPEGPTGIKSYGGGSPYWCFNVIPSSISDEKEVYNTLKFIEWMHSEEARRICCYGIEGRHYELTEDGKIDVNPYKENMDADFGVGKNSNFEWGWVSPYKGALDAKWGNVTDALANIELFDYVKKEPVDERYMEYIKFMTQFVDPYKYDSYINEDLKFTANTTIECVDKFYAKAITQKDFDFDAEWDKFVDSYLNEYKGAECLEIFKSIANK